MDGACQNRHKFEGQVKELRALLMDPENPCTRAAWSGWYKQSFVLRLEDNYRHFASNICHIRTIFDSIGGKSPKVLKSCFQSAAYNQIVRKIAPDPANRVRHKLARFKLGVPSKHPHVQLTARQATPAWTSEKALHNLHMLGQLVPPRVASAVFSTMWNRWVTSRRFQRRASASNQCVLGCGPSAEDSIEHYVNCPYTQELGCRYLRLERRQQINMHTFRMCNPHITTREDLTAAAVLVYAIYRATNSQRFSERVPRSSMYDALKQWAREGVVGHMAAERVLRERWRQYPPATDLPKLPLIITRSLDGRRKRSAIPSGQTGERSHKRRRPAPQGEEIPNGGASDGPLLCTASTRRATG
jgi:hypothetical protein